jgi:hypothetical protein
MKSLRIELLGRTLQSCVDEYKDKGITFSNLDTKAQNTTTIAGVFLAAVFAFLQGDNLTKFICLGGIHAIRLLGVSIVLLLSSALFCLYTMRIRKLVAPLESKALDKMVQDLLRADPSEFTDTIAENFLRDQVSVWKEVLTDMSRKNLDKAKAVFIGQVLLITAIIIIAILSLVIMYSAV